MDDPLNQISLNRVYISMNEIRVLAEIILLVIHICPFCLI